MEPTPSEKRTFGENERTQQKKLVPAHTLRAPKKELRLKPLRTIRYHSTPIQSEQNLKHLYRIDQAAYGDHSIGYQQFLNWWKKYPRGLTAIKSPQGRIVGGIGIWPISEKVFHNLSLNLTTEPHIQAKHILSTPQNHYWYLSGFVLTPTLRGNLLSGKLLLTLAEACQRKIPKPAKILAVATSDMGAKLLRRAGFKQEKTPENSSNTIYTKFVID